MHANIAISGREIVTINYTCNNRFDRRSERVHCALVFSFIAKLLVRVSAILAEKKQSGVRFPDASLRK